MLRLREGEQSGSAGSFSVRYADAMRRRSVPMSHEYPLDTRSYGPRIHIPDVREQEPISDMPLESNGGWRSLLAVPLLRSRGNSLERSG